MRVLHVVPSLGLRSGGVAAAVAGLADAGREAGVESVVVTTDASGGPSWRPIPIRRRDELVPTSADVRVYRGEQPHRYGYSRSLGRAIPGLVAQADIVHIHSLFLYPQQAAYHAAHRAGLPIVVSPHGALSPHLRHRSRLLKAGVSAWWQGAMLEEAAAVHVTSESERESILDLRWRQEIYVVPLPLRLPPLPPPRITDGDGLQIASHGRLSRRKGFDVLIQALPAVRSAVPGARLVLAGPDDEGCGRDLRALADRLGVSDALVMPGLLDAAGVRALLARTDVWVLPSHGENFGMAALEAMAMALPCVISPEVGLSREPGVAQSALVTSREPAAIADSIINLARDEHRRAELGTAAREVARRYDPTLVGPLLRSLYAAVIKGAG